MASSDQNISSGEQPRCMTDEDKKGFKSCIRHAAESIARESVPDTSKEPLCTSCSKTMLSYIFLIQDALDSLARKIYCDEDSSYCIQCLRQDFKSCDKSNIEENSYVPNSEKKSTECSTNVKNSEEKNSEENTNLVHSEEKCIEGISNGINYEEQNKEITPVDSQKEIIAVKNGSLIESPAKNSIGDIKPTRKLSVRRNSRKISKEQKETVPVETPECYVNRQGWNTEFLYNVTPSVYPTTIVRGQEYEDIHSTKNSITILSSDSLQPEIVDQKPLQNEISLEENKMVQKLCLDSDEKENKCLIRSDSSKKQEISSNGTCNMYPDDPDKLNFVNGICISDRNVADGNNSLHMKSQITESSLSLSTDAKTVRQSELQIPIKATNFDQKNDDISDSDVSENEISSEAFVTICRNNIEALGCLVLGSSLFLSRTSKITCVLVSDDIDPTLRNMLLSVFHVVLPLRDMHCANASTSSFLKRKNLEKLYVWLLVQFKKCVFLNPDTLVLRNCDELFEHEELSAVPDSGWPDCFNSGVFVFKPSALTFLQLVELAESQENKYGGEQILLNSYFNSWSRDIAKKLSFIYNLTGNLSYTYAPAFQRFGSNVKIVQFSSSTKPWHVKFFPHTSQIDEVKDFSPHCIRFFTEWISIFKVAVLRIFPQNIYLRIMSQDVLSVEDILSFLNSTVGKTTADSGANFANMNQLERSGHRNKDASPVQQLISNSTLFDKTTQNYVAQSICTDLNEISSLSSKTLGLPGADVGDYQGMRAWEQGHIDYEGIDNSENIIKRLEFLMNQSP